MLLIFSGTPRRKASTPAFVGASLAWAAETGRKGKLYQIWVPGAGWHGLDPSNNRLIRWH
jgi:hypothetical protein